MDTLLNFFAPAALADSARITPGLPGPLDPSQDGGVLAFVQNAYLLALAVAGLLALGSIAYGAVQYTLSRGNPAALADAWDRIVQALVGALLLVGAGAILAVVNPGLTTLQLPYLAPLEGKRGEGWTTDYQVVPTTPNPTGNSDQNPTTGNTTPVPQGTIPLPTRTGNTNSEGWACYGTLFASPYNCRVLDPSPSECGASEIACRYPRNDLCVSGCRSIGGTWHGVISGDANSTQCICARPQ